MKKNFDTTQILYVIIIGFVFLFTFKAIFDEKVSSAGDNCAYYSLGKALANGQGYVSTIAPEPTPNTHFYPGYPFIISLMLRFFDADINFLKVLNGLFLLGSALLVFFITRRYTKNDMLAGIMGVLIVLNYHLLQFSTIMMSELPYTFFSLLTVFFLTKVDYEKEFYKDKWFYISVAALVATYYMRAVGLALFAGLLFYVLLNKRWKHAIGYAVGFVPFVMLWMLRNAAAGGNSYTKYLTSPDGDPLKEGTATMGDYMARFGVNLYRYISQEIPNAIFPSLEVKYGAPDAPEYWLVGILIIAVAVFGILKLNIHKWLMLGYLLAMFALLCLWPEKWQGRFITPMVPFLYLTFFLGVYQLLQLIMEKASMQNKTLAGGIIGIFIFFHFSGVKELSQVAKTKIDPVSDNFRKAGKWIQENESERALVACRKPWIMHIYSEMPVKRYKYGTPEEILTHFRETKVKYVFLDNAYGESVRMLLPAVQQNPTKFKMLQQFQSGRLTSYLVEFVD